VISVKLVPTGTGGDKHGLVDEFAAVVHVESAQRKGHGAP
jgi:hypothetical protein